MGHAHATVEQNSIDSQHEQNATGLQEEATWWELKRLVNRHKYDLERIEISRSQEEIESAYANYDGGTNIGFILVYDKKNKPFLWKNTTSRKDDIPW